MPLTPSTRLGPYEITAPIGEGGMGQVYRARDTKLDRDVAIKVLPDLFANDPDRLARFQREAKTLAALNHPNIAHIHGLEESNGVRALVMELVEGEDLAQRIARGAIPIDEALAIAKQTADALEAAHEQGIIHRDLKPANIKVREDGTVKVLDFGLAKVVDVGLPPEVERTQAPTKASPALTFSGVVVGTPAYMSPEQALGKAVDKRCDIWSFGVVLYEMLTGQGLFRGSDGPETLEQVLTKPIDLSHVPSPVRGLLAKCLERDPKKRLRDIGDAWALLNAAPAPTAASGSISRMNRILTTVAALVLAAAAATVTYFWRPAPVVERVFRYTIAAPDRASTTHSFAISPDGRSLVMAATVSGRRQLWLRPLDALEARPIPSTDDGVYPFWSPDGRNIGFFAEGRLKRVPAVGGPAESLCPVVDARGGSWSRDDVILFSSALGGKAVIERISAAGGTPTQLTDPTADERHPFFLPDGQHYLVLRWRRQSGDAGGVYVRTLDGAEHRRLLADESPAVFVPSRANDTTMGHLLFVRDNELMAQPFDGGRAQLLGDARSLAKGVFLATNNTYAPVTASSTGLLLYERGGGDERQLAWYDRSGNLLEAFGMPGDQQAALSPDERTVAFQRGEMLLLRNLERGNEQILTNDGVPRGTPSWSPEGDRLVFGAIQDGTWNVFLKTLSDNAPDQLLLATANSKAVTQWSSEQQLVVYQEFSANNKRDIWLLPMTSGAERKPFAFLQTAADELFGQLSPDGHWMAYTSDERGRREVYVRPFPHAAGRWLISTIGGEQPRWRSDGAELFFEAADGKLTAVSVHAAPGPTPAFAVGAPEALFDAHLTSSENGAQYQYAVARDGKRFLVATDKAASTTARPLTVVLNWQRGLPN